MRYRTTVMLLGLTTALISAPSALAEPGTLVIVGGGLKPDNEEVYKAFLDARPDNMRTIAIIPAASGEAQRAADDFRNALTRYGADPSSIALVKLAIVDDPSTDGIDESLWRTNADNLDELATIARAGAIWFTGGDQSRITRLLTRDDGSETPMLAAIRARLDEGAVVGGTSAGAAIMSDPMITQGDALAALLPDAPGEALKSARGLGFLEAALVDQHFGERARLGRLAALLVGNSQPHRIGVGIDEDTALVVRAGSTRARVAGRGYVTLIDARLARGGLGAGQRFVTQNLMLSLGGSGDTLDLAAGSVLPSPRKRSTLGHEYYNAPPVSGGGMALGAASVAEVAGEALLDNAAARAIERHSFAGAAGVTYRFVQTDESLGWWGRGPDGTARYALSRIRFDIEPIDVTIKKAGN